MYRGKTPSNTGAFSARQLRCVIKSKVPITDVADYESSLSEARHQILVSVADGNVWVVTLPAHLQPGADARVTELVVEPSSSKNEPGMAQWFCQLPGVQSVQHTLADRTSLTLMRSFVTPSTLIVGSRGSSKPKPQRYQSLELDDLEGEQSTCSLCLNGQDLRNRGLLTSLFSNVASFAGVMAILQGDLDGSVRFSLICYPSRESEVTKLSVMQSGTLAQLDQPVQTIVPFTSCTKLTSFSEGNVPTDLSLEFDALLLLGTRGRIGVVQLKDNCLMKTLPVSLKKLELGQAVQSLVFVKSLGAFVFCSNRLAFVFSTDALMKAQSTDSDAQNNGVGICAEKLPFKPGILRLTTHDTKHEVSILFASGRVITITESALRAKVASVLPPEQQRNRKKVSSVADPTSESQVRNLLHRIAQTSTESTALRTQSQQMDRQLKTLHSALELLRIVETQGIESVIACKLRATVVATGTYSDRQTVKLMCSLRFVNPDAAVSLDGWCLCMHVRTRKCAVSTHSFPLNGVLARGEQTIILDPEMLALQDQGSLWVSCSMVFCPKGNGLLDTRYDRPNGIEFKPTSQEDGLSFAIPLLADRTFLLAQLSQPVEEEIPVSQVAIHSAFRQNHEPFMPVERKTEGGKASSSTVWSGAQWWTALADHARKNASFAALWSKIAPSDAFSIALSPPSRFVISIPLFFSAESEDEDDEDEDEHIEKARVERMVSFLHRLLAVHSDEVARLRRSCRTQHGKLWILLRCISGSLIFLRFTPTDDYRRSVDLSVQCSDVADLSAIRALILENIDKWSDEAAQEVSKDNQPGELVPDMSEMLEPIAALDNLLVELMQKTADGIVDPQSAICTDEVLHALSQLAYLEVQTLTLYWKSRLQLNRTIMS